MINEFRRFLQMEAAGGILLLCASVLALIFANTGLSETYNALLNIPVELRFGALEIAKPLVLWINDGLMSIFFLLVGLELKREFMEGELSRPDQIILPGVGAIGGMLVPALIYIAVNQGDDAALQGWAIPAATDIAFALGILALLGSRVPPSLKVFLVALAIMDDIGAIVIIALFYTAEVSGIALSIAAVCCVALLILNRLHIVDMSPYMLVGVIMWIAVLKSGVHATLAGVVLAFFIPITGTATHQRSPLKNLEHDLHGIVAFFVLPVFAFANAGVQLVGTPLDTMLHTVPVGVFLGLFLGKQIGILGFVFVAIKLKLAQLPKGATWVSLYGTAVLCGIGFTMSLFIGGLAFQDLGAAKVFDERLGILAGSFASGILGYLILHKTLGAPNSNNDEDIDEDKDPGTADAGSTTSETP